MALSEIHKTTLAGGYSVVFGQHAFTGGTVTIQTGLSSVKHVSVTLMADPGVAPDIRWSASGGAITIACGNISTAFSFAAYGLI